MTLLVPLGLLALLSLAVLLLIYIIRPNYQQKYISSTYIWKMSLKYRRRRIPTSRVRNILIIVCQVLILAACAIIIAEPAIEKMEEVSVPELAIIIDSSSSMRSTDDNGESRFERAVSLALDDAIDVLDAEGFVTLVMAAGDCEMPVCRVSGREGETKISEALDNLLHDGCTYGTSDLNAAISLCESEVLSFNPDAVIRIYTDMDYTYYNGVEVVNVADPDSEYNVAILEAYTESVDGYYVLFADFRSYGGPTTVDVKVTYRNATFREDPKDINSEVTRDVEITTSVELNGDSTSTLVIVNSETYVNVYAGVLDEHSKRYQVYSSDSVNYYNYEEIEVRILDSDSYDLDDVYYVYGGKPVGLNLLYVSTETNVMTPYVLSAVTVSYAGTYTISTTSYTGMTRDEIDGENASYYNSGYDIYVYEHIAPTSLPTDGAVFLFDPDIAPAGCGFTMDSVGHEDTAVNHECYLSATEYAEDCGLMRGIEATSLTLTKASILYDYEDDYIPLMTYECDEGICPALLLKDTGDTQIVVVTFSVHYSNIALRPEFVRLFYNFISYFFPATVSGSDFTVGDVASLNSAGSGLTVWYAEYSRNGEVGYGRVFDVSETDGVFSYTDDYGNVVTCTLPLDYEFTEPGRYLLRITTYFTDNEDNYRDVYVYVHADTSESDIFAVGSALSVPYRVKSVSDYYDDLMLWFAIILVAVLFIEYILHLLEGM